MDGVTGSTSGGEETVVLDGPPEVHADVPLTAGDTIGRYAVLEQVGAGGMGRVYRAYDARLRRMVAIKLLRRQTSADAQARMVREAQAMAQLSHPNVLPVYDVDTADGRVYLAMEYVEGTTLSKWLEQQQAGWRGIVRAYLQAGRGLAAAHVEGLVHRDFKPSNVLVGSDDRVRVVDFGLVRVVDDPDDESAALSSGSERLGDLGSLPDLTGVDTVMGTPAYMSPEQHFGRQVDARSDQFSFCVSLFESLYGQRPFSSKSYAGLAHVKSIGRINEPPPGPRVPRRLRALLMRGLAANPEDRYATMDALLDDLARVVRPARIGWVLGIGAVAVATWAAERGDAPDPEAECRAASSSASAPWEGPIRDGVREAIAASGAAAPEAVFERIDGQLSAWEERWREARYAACAATRVAGEQSDAMLDKRMQCLRRRALELEALGGAWAEGLDGEAVAAAVRTSANLPRLDPCADVEALGRAVPPPEDADDAARVEELRDDLARASGEARAGRAKQAAEAIEAVKKSAESLAYRPLLAEVELAQGSTLEDLGKADEAIEHWSAAHYDAVATGAATVAAESATLIAFGYGGSLADPKLAEAWGRHAQAWVDQLGSPQHEARLLEALGANRMAESRYEEALAMFERALEIRTSDPSDDDPLSITFPRTHVGIASMRLGRYEQAVQALDANLQLQLEILGPGHIDLAMTRTNLANALERQGDLVAAESNLRAALAGFEGAYGPEHPAIAVVLTNLGNVLTSREQIDAAQPVFERALEVAEAAFDPDHPVVSSAYNNVGENLHARGKLDEAEAAHRSGLELRRRRLGDEHPDVAVSLANLAEIDIDRERWTDARDRLEQALAIRRGAQIDPSLLAGSEYLLGQVLWDGDLDRERARELVTAARERYAGLESGERGVERCDALLARMRPAP